MTSEVEFPFHFVQKFNLEQKHNPIERLCCFAPDSAIAIEPLRANVSWMHASFTSAFLWPQGGAHVICTQFANVTADKSQEVMQHVVLVSRRQGNLQD